MQCLVAYMFQQLSSFKYNALLAATLVCLLSPTISANAGLLIDIAPNSTAPGTTGSLEVTLTNTGTDPLDEVIVAGFSFEITASGNDVTFSAVSTGTSLFPYIFGANSAFGPDILANLSTDKHTVSASDNYSTSSTGVTLTPGETVSLGLVSFALSSSAPAGLIPITFSAFAATGGSDPSGNDIVFGLSTTGGINVVTVPEPSTFVSMLLGAFGTSIVTFRRRNLAV